jgi:hypothetical protein
MNNEKQERYNLKVVNLNNKSRKGSFVYIYDTKEKKGRHYPYDPRISLDHYIAYQSQNKEQKVSTKQRIRKTLAKQTSLRLFEKQRYEQKVKASEFVHDFAKKYMKPLKEIEFDRKQGFGFDVNQKIKELYKKYNFKNNKDYLKAIKNHEALAKYANAKVLFYGDNYETKEHNVYLGFAEYTSISLNNLNQILNSADIENRKIDPSGGGEYELDLKIDLKTDQLSLKRVHGRIINCKIIYNQGLR